MSELELILTKLKIVSEAKENGAYICDKEHSKILLKEIERLNHKLQQKENIIKEVREYIENHTTYERYGYIDELQLIDLDFSIKDLKQILDKENI